VIADDLVNAAAERVGADDFGEASWCEGLEVLVDSVNREAGLHELGREVVADQLVGFLAKRLEVERCYREHPEIEEEEIVAPLFGLGLPRTGSTALSFLLAADPARRSLRAWEADQPCPPPVSATEHTDPRIAQCQAGIEFANEMFPDFQGMLPTSATGPQECVVIMALGFRSEFFEMIAWTPSYNEWLLSCDMEPAYRYHQRVLKLLQWRCPPRRWWLKTPAHMASIRGLNAVYPDARFVMTHRDIASVIVSVCALMEALTGPLTERDDPRAIGRYNADLWAEALRRLIEFRDDGNEARFHDVLFADLQGDPIRTMERLYEQLGDPLDANAKARMADWWDNAAGDRRAAARQPERYGLNTEELRQRFAFYHERFEITPEAR
jgi:hypothetical protein